MDETVVQYIQGLPLTETQKEFLLNAFKAEEKKTTVADFKYKRTVADKTAMTNILNASIEEIKKQKKIIEDSKNEINRNLTELDLQKKLVEEKNMELNKVILNLQSTQKQLIHSEKMASLGELTAGVAHEIQNPLNFVNNFSEVNFELISEMIATLSTGDIQEAISIADMIKENAAKITHHGKRADAIVKGMLQHSRMGSGQKEPTDINALCEEYLRLSFHGLRAKDKDFNSEMKTDLDPSIGKINVIPQEIGRVFINLFNNAFFAVNEKKKSLNAATTQPYAPQVAVVTKKCDGKIDILVKDNGNGIPQKIIDKIFQPFFTTKPTGQGTGLGLSLSYDVIKVHGGEIKVNTKEGQGTEFIIQLPVT